MPSVALFLQGQAANWTVGHFGSHTEVIEHVAHQGLVILEHAVVAKCAGQGIQVVTARHNGGNLKLGSRGCDHCPGFFGRIWTLHRDWYGW